MKPGRRFWIANMLFGRLEVFTLAGALYPYILARGVLVKNVDIFSTRDGQDA